MDFNGSFGIHLIEPKATIDVSPPDYNAITEDLPDADEFIEVFKRMKDYDEKSVLLSLYRVDAKTLAVQFWHQASNRFESTIVDVSGRVAAVRSVVEMDYPISAFASGMAYRLHNAELAPDGSLPNPSIDVYRFVGF